MLKLEILLEKFLVFSGSFELCIDCLSTEITEFSLMRCNCVDDELNKSNKTIQKFMNNHDNSMKNKRMENFLLC
jgi:hypothetical protein